MVSGALEDLFWLHIVLNCRHSRRDIGHEMRFVNLAPAGFLYKKGWFVGRVSIFYSFLYPTFTKIFTKKVVCKTYDYSNHALLKMFRRNISAEEVEETIINGIEIRDYPNDKPYPSFLVLHFPNKRPLHVVISKDIASGTCFVITAYEPEQAAWTPDFTAKI